MMLATFETGSVLLLSFSEKYTLVLSFKLLRNIYVDRLFFNGDKNGISESMI